MLRLNTNWKPPARNHRGDFERSKVSSRSLKIKSGNISSRFADIFFVPRQYIWLNRQAVQVTLRHTKALLRTFRAVFVEICTSEINELRNNRPTVNMHNQGFKIILPSHKAWKLGIPSKSVKNHSLIQLSALLHGILCFFEIYGVTYTCLMFVAHMSLQVFMIT